MIALPHWRAALRRAGLVFGRPSSLRFPPARPRTVAIDDLPPSVLRDIGFTDGRSHPPRDPLLD